MNLNAHIMRLHKIREKMERGEALSDREVAYVRALWRRIAPIAKRFVEQIARDARMDIETLATRLEVEATARRRRGRGTR